jgi:carbonic anhydrase
MVRYFIEMENLSFNERWFGAPPLLSPDQALEELMDGNERYVSAKQRYPNQTMRRRAEVSEGQRPFATMLGCADSRVPHEIIFDQGLGDLFVVRVAGNVLSDVVVGSIEFAITELRTPLVMVLGHSRCGAVEAAIHSEELPGQLPSITRAICPAVAQAREQPGDLWDNAVRMNAMLVAEQLRAAPPILTEYINRGWLKVAAAYYNLHTGVVEVISTKDRYRDPDDLSDYYPIGPC